MSETTRSLAREIQLLTQNTVFLNWQWMYSKIMSASEMNANERRDVGSN